MTTLSTNVEVWFIHGANATPTSFSFIESSLRNNPMLSGVPFVQLEYNYHDPLDGIIDSMITSIPKDKKIILVGHSLGGVIALGISQRMRDLDQDNILGVVTISAPIGGSDSANMLMFMFPHYALFRNIATSNPSLHRIKRTGIVVPTLSFVSSGGNNPIIREPNDGVVTLSSQRAIRHPGIVEIDLNHFEVLLSTEVSANIFNFLIERLTVKI